MALRTCLIMMAALALVSLVVMALFPHWNSEMAAGFIHALSGAMAALAMWWGHRATRQGNTRDGTLPVCCWARRPPSLFPLLVHKPRAI